MWTNAKIAHLPVGLVVGSMCHCDEPDECDDHWEFFYDAEVSDDGEHVRRGRHLTERQMRAIASLVTSVRGTSPIGGQEDD